MQCLTDIQHPLIITPQLPSLPLRRILLQRADPQGPSSVLNTAHSTYLSTKIFFKHWNILKSDLKLSPILSHCPKTVFRKSKNVKNYIAPSKLPLVQTATIFQQFTNISHIERHVQMQKTKLPDLRLCHSWAAILQRPTYHIKEFFTCSTSFVVYCTHCCCGMQYVGRTVKSL